jgi:arginine repressor
MHLGGASTAELQRWLRKNRIKVVHSTVARWLAKHTAPIH